jgi:hypothetical protein
MKGERVIIDGRVGEFGALAPDELLAANFVYQKIAVFGRRAMGVRWAAEVLEAAWAAMATPEYGTPQDTLSREITALLDANGYPAGGGVLVAVYVFPDADGRPVRLISCEKQLVWREMSHSTGVRALVVPCEVPFAGCRTAASLAAQTCAGLYARRRGYDAAICENAAGVLTTMGDAPLFAAEANRVFVAPSADSVERRMGIAACRAAGLELYEEGFTAAALPHFDEVFALTPQGITSISELDGRSLTHSLAAKVIIRCK